MKESQLHLLVEGWWHIAVDQLNRDDEPTRRAAISRLYYAILTVSRMVSKTPMDRLYQLHTKVAKDTIALIPKSRRKEVKRAYKRLLDLRGASDYELLGEISATHYDESIYHANLIIDALVDAGLWHHPLPSIGDDLREQNPNWKGMRDAIAERVHKVRDLYAFFVAVQEEDLSPELKLQYYDAIEEEMRRRYPKQWREIETRIGKRGAFRKMLLNLKDRVFDNQL